MGSTSDPPAAADAGPCRGPAGTLLVNGVSHPWRPGLTLEALLRELGASGPGVAVERNLAVVRRCDHGSTELVPGDRLEIMRLVGGG